MSATVVHPCSVRFLLPSSDIYFFPSLFAKILPLFFTSISGDANPIYIVTTARKTDMTSTCLSLLPPSSVGLKWLSSVNQEGASFSPFCLVLEVVHSLFLARQHASRRNIGRLACRAYNVNIFIQDGYD